MSSLPSVTGRDAVKAFSQAGFAVVRIRGSHHVMKKSGHPNNVVVPVHGGRTIPPGTLRSLIADAGLSVEEFIRLLG
jgi:predicted RNA binding protein YcfA (HicA-like mRNA interferase family)